MDRNLKNAMDGFDSLSREVREGTFVEKVSPGERGAWRHKGIVFAAEVSEPEKNSSGRQSPSFTIITPHAQEAGALLERLLELFQPLLDRCFEQDFLDRLGEAALEYSGYADPSDQTAVNLLKILLTEVEDILAEMERGEFPYTASGPES